MPVIRVTVPQNAWSAEEKALIAEKLTDGLAHIAEESGKGDIRNFINLHVEEVASGGYAVGGRVLA